MEFMNMRSDREEGEVVSSSEDEALDTVEQPGGDLFFIDTNTRNGEHLPEANTALYNRAVSDEDFPVPKQRQGDDSEMARSEKLVSCFNCMGNHFLKNCPEKLDYKRIRENRVKLLVSSEPSARYHQSAVNGRSFGRPGHISKGLRKALGLRFDQLPMYIYHMRILDYPPGWLKEAEVVSSGLTLYDNANKKDSETSSKPVLSYDVDKLIKYPGYNSSLPKGVVDEWKDLRMPPLQRSQELSEFVKKKRSSSSEEHGRKMKSMKSSRPKRKNVKQENDASVSNGDSTTFPSETPVLSCAAAHKEEPSHNGILSSTRGCAVTVNYGNPFKKLPDLSKFSQNIFEELPFENLPGVIAGYHKVMSVLRKDRKFDDE